ncbi:MAG: hypothetical protein GX548_00395 [Lentisphaerae bacterium]|nr:hypothetical protein [Lentisphaerota bacterium]
MKWNFFLALALFMGAAGSWAQDVALEKETIAASLEDTQDSSAIQITDTEATTIVQTIKGYMEGATHRGHLEILDRRKGELVTLRLDRVVTDDPHRIVFPSEGLVAICGECSRITTVVDSKGHKEDQETGEPYEVWFVIQRGNIVTARVLDTYIKSANGVPMYTWTRNADGQWTATMTPAPAQESPAE